MLEGIKAAGMGAKDLAGLPGGDLRKARWRRRKVASRVAGDEAERRERESDVEKNRMEEPFEDAASNARRIYRGGKKRNELAP